MGLELKYVNFSVLQLDIQLLCKQQEAYLEFQREFQQRKASESG